MDYSFSNSLPSGTKSVLVKILGKANLLTCPVLRTLAHEDIVTASFEGPIAKNSTAKILSECTNLQTLIMPGNVMTSEGQH